MEIPRIEWTDVSIAPQNGVDNMTINSYGQMASPLPSYVAVDSALIVTSCNKMLSYRRETALQGTLVLAESRRLELGDNILLIL